MVSFLSLAEKRQRREYLMQLSMNALAAQGSKRGIEGEMRRLGRGLD